MSNCVFEANQAVATASSYEPTASGQANGGALFHGSGVMTIDGTLFSSNRTTGGPATNLFSWMSVGTKVADTNGEFQLDEIDLQQVPRRFYRVETK